MQLKMVFLLFPFVSLIACSSTPEVNSQPAPDISQQMNGMGDIQKGFSLSFPGKDEWMVAENKPYKVVMSKQGNNSHERYIIQALVVKLPKFESDTDFLEFISMRMKNSPKRSDVKIMEQNVQLIEGKGRKCVQYNSKEQREGKSRPVMFETVNYTCRHSEKENAGVYLAYSRKNYQDNDDKDFTVSAAEIFSHLQLEAF